MRSTKSGSKSISIEEMKDGFKYKCDMCDIYYYPFDDETIVKYFNFYEVEWYMQESSTYVHSAKGFTHFNILLPFDIKEDKLKLLLVFS